MKPYRVEQNPHGSWAIVELWEGGVVRSPFRTREAAIEREEQVAEYDDFAEELVLEESDAQGPA